MCTPPNPDWANSLKYVKVLALNKFLNGSEINEYILKRGNEKYKFGSEASVQGAAHMFLTLGYDTQEVEIRCDAYNRKVTVANLEQNINSESLTVSNSMKMEIWARADKLSTEALCQLIMERGQDNKMDLSTPHWFDFNFVTKLLDKLAEDEELYDMGVILLNNVMGMEIVEGSFFYLLKMAKNIKAETGTDQFIPCIYRYRDFNNITRLLRNYPVYSVEGTDKEGKEIKKKYNWAEIWMNSKFRLEVVGGMEFNCYPINSCPLPCQNKITNVWEYTNQKRINTFTGYNWSFQEIKECAESEIGKEAIKKYMNYMLNIICNDDEKVFEYLINFLKFCVKFPGVKTRVCPYIKGQKGIGKSLLLFRPFQLLFHRHSSYLAGQLLSDDFNGKLRDGVVYINLDEFPPKFKGISNFKSLITEPHLNIRAMYQDQYLAPNHLNFVITSNYDPSPELEITKDERRFVCIQARQFNIETLNAHKKKMTDFFYNCLMDEERYTGFKAIIYHLLTSPDPPKDFQNEIPKTPLFLKTVEKTMNWAESFAKMCIERGGVRSKFRADGSVEYIWPDDLMSWDELRIEMVNSGTTNASEMRMSKSKNQDIENLKKVFLPKEMATKKLSTKFELRSREDHYYHFLRLWPGTIFHFKSQDLVIDRDIFQKTQREAQMRDPVYQETYDEIREWTLHDHVMAYYELKKSGKIKGLNKRAAEEQDHVNTHGPAEKRVKRVYCESDEEGVDQ